MENPTSNATDGIQLSDSNQSEDTGQLTLLSEVNFIPKTDTKDSSTDQARKRHDTRDQADSGWFEPEPLTTAVEARPYPVDALPHPIRNAITEVAKVNQAPVSMVACCALAALSIAGQHIANPVRDRYLTGPASLWFLVLAKSGERKSSIDSLFMRPIRDYESELLAQYQDHRKTNEIATKAWNEKARGVEQKIKALSKEGKPTNEAEVQLTQLHKTKPADPPRPLLITNDPTTEALINRLASDRPSMMLASNEAGTFFGGHAMSKEKAMAGMGHLNTLWDGQKVSVDRVHSGITTIEGARLTVSLMAQPAVMEEHHQKSGGLARGIGFMARMLIAQPESTQGRRAYQEPCGSFLMLERFCDGLSALIRHPMPLDNRGQLSPRPLPLSSDAKAIWVEAHDRIERQLGTGGRLSELTDVASKAAENIARLAALFELYADPQAKEICLDSIRSSCEVIEWHLHEALRLFHRLGISEAERDQQSLDAWLLNHCKQHELTEVSRTDVLQRGPSRLRRLEKLKGALEGLEQLNRVRVAHRHRKHVIQVHPDLLKRRAT